MPFGSQHMFQDAVSALAYSLAQEHATQGRAELQPPYNDLTRLVLAQQARMPDFLHAPMRLATLGFDLSGLLRGGFFHSGPPSRRRRQILSWKNSKLSFRRDLIRYYESLVTLALFSRDASTNEFAPDPSAWWSTGQLGYVSQDYGLRDASDETTKLNYVLGSLSLPPTGELRCQIAVIGSGPGGAISACMLAEAGRDVLLLEEGPFHPPKSCLPFSLQEMAQKYRNGGQTVALGRNKIAYVEGRCVGGGSEINSGLYHRTPPEVLETWRRDFQVEALTEAELRPHFEVCERDLSVGPSPWPAAGAAQRMEAGAKRLGWKWLEAPRWVRYGDGPEQSKRQTMSRTYIPRLLKAKGRLLALTRVERLRRDGKTWILQARHGKTARLQIRAETVFVCAGAVQTPALLRRSGITRNIGNSLRLHPTIKLTARFAEAINTEGMGVPAHQVKEFAPRLSFGCSISSRPYLALGLLDHPNALQQVPEAWSTMANYYAMITGQGYGTVRLLPGFSDPLVRYRLTTADRRDLADGLRKLSELLFAAGAVEINPGLARSSPLTGLDDLMKLPSTLPESLASLITIHLFSSCPMGEDQKKCATDSFGRVHGIENLVVSDASLLCTAPGVNPQGTVMALARRNAAQFLQD